MRRGIHHHDRGAQEVLTYRAIQGLLPGPLRRYLLYFEAEIEASVERFAHSLPPKQRVLDAGAGESRHAAYFGRQRYIAVDLAVGDAAWNYRRLDVIADLSALPFRSGCFDACINIVTLEHVTAPLRVLEEIARTLAPGGRLLLIAPQDWEVHQAPHDYFRYTRHGLAYLLAKAGFKECAIEPVGGYFRLMSRRLLNGLQFFPGPLILVAALFLVPPALVMPLFDGLDRKKDFTLGYICSASM